MSDSTAVTAGHAPRFACDLILKGGITSGVVYPPAIVELARDHRFHDIGGSSAGAIAAVAAAAAEYGRQSGTDRFDELAAIPDDLAVTDDTGRTLLQRLFVPQPDVDEYFDLFWQQRALQGGAVRRLRSLLPAVLRHGNTFPSWPAALVALLLPGAAVVCAVLAPSAATVAFAILSVLVGAVVMVVDRAVSGLRAMVTDVRASLDANMHGLVAGRSVGEQVGLTDWLHDRVERLAGRDDDQTALTYGDLARHDIRLVTLTTNVSQSSSENFPFDDATWAFDPDDMRRLFPAPVTDHLVARGEAATTGSRTEEQLRAQGLLRLPPPAELPIVLGARISLSFPVVITAVPLWRLSVERVDHQWVTRYRQVWLSDGGICSNMPVHLFDAPLPSRPTYGINLGTGAIRREPGADADAALRDAHADLWRPLKAGSGGSAPITTIDSTVQLLAGVLNTMQNWSDNSTIRSLGVRDRICTVRLATGEGGMNLDMPPDTIRGLTLKGQAAGENLGWMVRGTVPTHVDDPGIRLDRAEHQWLRHRWTRLRSVMLGTEDFVNAVARGWSATPVPQHGPTRAPHERRVADAGSPAADRDHYDESVTDGGTEDPLDVGARPSYAELAARARDLGYLPYRSDWTVAASTALPRLADALIAMDFADVNTASPPPLRPLVLSSRWASVSFGSASHD